MVRNRAHELADRARARQRSADEQGEQIEPQRPESEPLRMNEFIDAPNGRCS